MTWSRILLGLTLLYLGACATLPKNVYQEGGASWYGSSFQGHKTASGERYDANAMTAAHLSLPFGTKVRVVSPDTGASVIVRINDRGPHARGRIIDLSKAAAQKLGIVSTGVAKVYLYLLPQ